MPFVIDVDPVAFTLLGIPVRWYGLIVVGAAALGIWLAQREGPRQGVGDEILSDAVIWVAVAALVGGRALYIIQNELGSIASDPFHVVMIWQGGLSFYGGLLAAIGALVIFARRRWPRAKCRSIRRRSTRRSRSASSSSRSGAGGLGWRGSGRAPSPAPI